ncbi:MAG: hypothetical protein M1828_004668 [Chrysothrix sp. TS-e1954]|nr:MAG: hypothetical protein M1828_004668 [Chrysothrix sp. TS-e1954]
MAPYFSAYVARSDGKLETRTSKQATEPNQPSSDQLDQKPNAQGVADYYRECKFGEIKEQEWRRKLGGMLMRELGSKENKDQNFLLAALPENYRVFEHVKSKVSEKDGKTHKIAKSHAAGGNERQDAYLYGHPGGRKKRYRSPAEFFPHLLWLTTDQRGDSDNCSCKFCSPEELDLDDKPQPKPASKDAKHDSNPHSRSNSKTSQNSTQARAAPNQSTKRPSSPTNSLTPLPRFRSIEQKLDAQGDKFFYRCGEIVWFARGTAWGLGVIFRRDASTNSYRIQPLSHPFHHPIPITCQFEQLRPWLAWSPPPSTCSDLNPTEQNHHRILSYGTIDWRGVLAGKYGPGDAEVDGSIFAAKAAETTFTPFDPVNSNTMTNTISYNGIYIGGEKIWIGDPLRLRNSAFATDMMVLHEIIEHPSTSPQESYRPRISLVGDTYSYRIAQLERLAVPKDVLHLPVRVRDDLVFRNAITASNPDSQKRYTMFWRLNARGVKLEIGDIKGRWYETSRLLPVIDAQNYNNSRHTGEINDVGLYMNAQGDSNRTMQNKQMSKPRPAENKARKREDAFFDAVPKTFKISRGLDESKRDAPSHHGTAPVVAAPVQHQTKREIHPGAPAEVKAQTTQPVPYQARPQSNATLPSDARSAQALAQEAYRSSLPWPNLEAGNTTQMGNSYDVNGHSTVISHADGNNGQLGEAVPSEGLDQYMQYDDENSALSMPGFGEQYSSQDLSHDFYGNGTMQH